MMGLPPLFNYPNIFPSAMMEDQRKMRDMKLKEDETEREMTFKSYRYLFSGYFINPRSYAFFTCSSYLLMFWMMCNITWVGFIGRFPLQLGSIYLDILFFGAF